MIWNKRYNLGCYRELRFFLLHQEFSFKGFLWKKQQSPPKLNIFLELKCLNMLSFGKRCYLFDVTFLCKALNGYLSIDLTPFLNYYSQVDPYRFRHIDDYSLKLNFAWTTKSKYSYFNRIVELWSSLPLEIRLAPSLEAFRFNVKTISYIIVFWPLVNAHSFPFYSIIYFNDVYVFNIHIRGAGLAQWWERSPSQLVHECYND